jgi:nicotinamidase-related amidase
MSIVNKNRQHILVLTCIIAMTFLFALSSLSSAETIIDEWVAVKAPPPPALKGVTIEPKTTALLLLDFNKQTCNLERRPRCVASIPKVANFLKDARAKGVFVAFSLSAGALVQDIAKELAPLNSEPVVTSGPDKFFGTDLERILREKGIKTVIATGTASHGAVLYTASAAALREFRVIVPLDAVSAEDTYPEQYVAWHLVNAPRVSSKVTLTRTDLIKY